MWPDGLSSNNWHKDIRQGLESLNVVPGDVHVHVPPTETELKYQVMYQYTCRAYTHIVV